MTEFTDPLSLNISTPQMARIYDYWLGGGDHFQADRRAGDLAMAVDPNVVPGVRANRRFLGRAVRFMAAEGGIRQFLDIGTGIPAANNTHEIAQNVAPEARVVYVDNDPVVLAHAHALLTSATGTTAYVDADARDTGTISREAARTLDFGQPVGVLLIAILHCIPDEDSPGRIVRDLMAAVPEGSYLAITHPASDQLADAVRCAEALTRSMGRKLTFRTREQVTGFFAGLELGDPGVVPIQQWRTDSDLDRDGTPVPLWGGVALKSA